MPRSRSSYTASPTRYRSPQRSPERRPSSEDGSQYEMDLDALGLNSTFESSGIDVNNAPQVDVVDTSDIEGPEDFTMNMTYWMTADLPLSQIKSRKEANSHAEDERRDAREGGTDVQDTLEEGDKVVIDDTARDRVVSENLTSGSPTVHANGNVDGSQDENGLAESSMENDEKVMSYLSALPDTDLPGAITSTPLKIMKGNMLQVPTPAGTKARSLQATVEDYDTPRKSTQETVIRHIQESAMQLDDTNNNTLQDQIADLQSRLEQQELTSKTRITELETILAYTRSELDTARRENYKQKEHIAALESQDDKHRATRGSDSVDVANQIRDKERELSVRMQEFGEELRLQNLAKLQNQREDFEWRLRASEEARRAVEEQLESKNQLVAQLRSELGQIRQSKEEEFKSIKDMHSIEQQKHEQKFAKEQESLKEQLSAFQTRAETLREALEKATADAQAARQEAETFRNEARQTQHLQSSGQSAQYTSANSVEDFESHVRSLKAQLDSSRADASSKDQQLLRNIEEQERLDQQLHTAQGRIEGLETTISTLRQQLADAHRESSKARTDVERLENDLEEWSERLDEARRESDRRVADVEKKLNKMKELKSDAETQLKELQSEHETLIEDQEARLEAVRSKAEDAVRKAGAMLETERGEKKRIARELKTAIVELDRLRAEAAKKAAAAAAEDDSEEEISMVSSHSDSKEVEIENLRTLLRNQASAIKNLKSERATLRKKTRISSSLQPELEALRYENSNLKTTIETLKLEAETQRQDFEAVNKAMDERLAAVLSKVVKERSKTVIGKRDDQWAANVGKLQGEKEFLGKVLMREWGRQDCGAAEEKENQLYQYQYVRRS